MSSSVNHVVFLKDSKAEISQVKYHSSSCTETKTLAISEYANYDINTPDLQFNTTPTTLVKNLKS